MSWAKKRRTTYIATVGGVLLILFGVPALLYFNDPVSCSDGIQNQDERGVDCGGSCQALCQEQLQPLSVLWSRPFKIDDGVYSAVALVKNPNLNAGVKEVLYSFKLYDRENILITEREGSTFVSAGGQFAIIENSFMIGVGNRMPHRVFFEITSIPFWERIPDGDLDVRVKDQKFESLDSTPRLRATVTNQSLFSVEDMEVVALLYDGNDNVISAGNTEVSFLGKGDSKDVTFLWAQPFSEPVQRVEVLPRVNRLR